MMQHAAKAAELLRALANEQRLAILCVLIGRKLSVGQINEHIDLSQSALSQHLAVLREKKLVTTEKRAQTVYYSVPPGPVHKILAVLQKIYCQGETSTTRAPSPQPKT
nr:transcriptional regulator [Gammaproteobacteria bacterium]